MKSLRPGDPMRAGTMATAALVAALAGPHAAMPLAIIVPPALALRLLAIPSWLDGALCAALLIAQAGAIAGLTDATAAWDVAAHFVVGGLLAIAVTRAASVDRLRALAVVGALALTWEVVEELIDTTAGTDLAPTRGDTATDLIAGVGGAVVAVAVLAARPRPAPGRP